MINICNPLQIKVYWDNGDIIVNEPIYENTKLVQSCDDFDTLTTCIRKNCKIRKKQKIELCEWSKIWTWYINDYKNILSDKKECTTLDIVWEKYLMKWRLWVWLPQTYSWPYEIIVQGAINNLNTLWWQQFIYSLPSIWNVSLDNIWDDTELYWLFDQIAEQLDTQWTISWNQIIFWSLGKICDVSLEYNNDSCNNSVDIEISEWDRASYVIWVNKNGTEAIKYNYAWWDFWMLKKRLDNLSDSDLPNEVQKCLDKLSWQHLIYKIKNIKRDFDCDICDKIRLYIYDCDEWNFDWYIQIKQKTTRRENCKKYTEYTLSNWEIQAYRLYDILKS